MSATLALDFGEEDRVLLVPRSDGEFASVGVVAEVLERMRVPGGGQAVTVQGLYRGTPENARTYGAGDLRVARSADSLPGALAWIGGLLIIFIPLCVWRYRRMS